MPPKRTFAMVLEDARKLSARELPVPDVTHDTAILRIETCGICGSDYEQFEGVLPAPVPAIPGHEPLGVIEAIGDGAAQRWGVNAGDRVAVENMVSCRFCAQCLAGKSHLCRNRIIYSYVPVTKDHGLWGAYAQYMVLHGNSVVHKMDPDLPASLAVLFNPLGAGYRWAVEMPQTKPGDSVVILGPGQRGLASVLAAKEAGASTIIVTGLAADAKKLALCKEFGADATIDVEGEDAHTKIRELTGGRGADIVVEVTSYSTQPVTDAIDYVAQGGTIVLAGVKGLKAIPDFVSDKIVLKEITIRGAIGVTSSAYRSAIRLIESRTKPLEKMHTHDFALADAEQAIRTLARQVEGEDAIHCCLYPEH